MRFTIVILSALLCLSARAEVPAGDKDSDDALVAAAEKLVSDGKATNIEGGKISEAKTSEAAPAAVSETVATQIAQDMKQESEIPVFTKSEKVSKSENSLLWRLVASLAFVVAVGAGLIFTGRRWTRGKNKGGEKARIEMMHQFHMGPKKSLALIRVAGEVVLIGCTDHNISLLKTVTLIDDELEGTLGKDFNNFLEDDFAIEDMRKALIPRA